MTSHTDDIDDNNGGDDNDDDDDGTGDGDDHMQFLLKAGSPLTKLHIAILFD